MKKNKKLLELKEELDDLFKAVSCYIKKSNEFIRRLKNGRKQNRRRI